MHRRNLNPPYLQEQKSFFLLGPRATRKTTLIDATLTDALVIDLLEARTFTSPLKDPGRLEEMINDPSRVVVIDEVQKLPSLLDEVHRLIQKKTRPLFTDRLECKKTKTWGCQLTGWTCSRSKAISANVR